MATIPSWVNPPDYLRAMSSGANLGLNVRQQGFNERMSIEQLRQDQVRQALAVEQLRAAERRAIESDRLRALQFQAEENRFGQNLAQQKAALDLRTRQQDFDEDMAMLPAAMTPYQEASLGLREQIAESKPVKAPTLSLTQKTELDLIKGRISTLRSELSKTSPKKQQPILDAIKGEEARLMNKARSFEEASALPLLAASPATSSVGPLPAGNELMASGLTAPMTNMLPTPVIQSGKVKVVAPNGKVGFVPQSQLEEAIKDGYKPL